MSTFTLAISWLTTSNLPWFMDLTFQVPMQYCSLQHRTLLLSPVTSTAGYCFCFGSISIYKTELLCYIPETKTTLQISYTSTWKKTPRGKFLLKLILYSLPLNSTLGTIHFSEWHFLGGQQVPNMLLEISGEITPERMKGWSQSKNNTQLWMWLVIKARSNAIRTILHRKLEC